MTRALALFALAATLGAQDFEITHKQEKGSVQLAPTGAVIDVANAFAARNDVKSTTLPARVYDGNGALEAFYVRPAHHNILKSRKFWGIMAATGIGFGIGVAINSTRGGSAHYSPIPAPIGATPSAAAPEPTVNGVTFIGIGGPGIPVAVSKGGAN